VFTGIVAELGEVVAAADLGSAPRLTIRGPIVAGDLTGGDSVAVSGVCLTAVEVRDGTFTADVMRETLQRSTLGRIGPGGPVNLELPLTLAARLGGHLVQGHVDGVGAILERTPDTHWETVRVDLPPGLVRYVVEKGSIAVDGVSLTVTGVTAESFTVGLIPETLARTTLGRAPVGAPVNLEVDVMAKYVEKLLAARLETA
jgi:riboflavin synthase